MLEQVLQETKNWFIVPNGVHSGTYTIQEGGVTLPFLRDRQYFRIIGSVFNDGLYQYGPDMEPFQDETFEGAVWALAIPKAVIKLAEEIAAWQEKYGEITSSPYSSESYGGYTYTKAGGANENGGAGGWQSAFRSRLNTYRKLKEF